MQSLAGAMRLQTLRSSIIVCSVFQAILEGSLSSTWVAGKGRNLIAAGLLGFRKLIGVEFVPELARIARTNLAKAGVKNAVIANTDAADFRFPSEELVLYLFNPFSEEVMRRVLDNLREAFPAGGFIIYNNPRCAELFDSSTFLGRVGSVSGTRYPTLVWSIQSPRPGSR